MTLDECTAAIRGKVGDDSGLNATLKFDCGEAGTIGACPSLMNAIVDALVPYGVTAMDMPATPLRVWQAVQANSRQAAE